MGEPREQGGDGPGATAVAQQLAVRVAELEAQRSELERAVDQVRQARSLTFTDDEHDPEGSTASLDQARDVALLDGVRRTLEQLYAARERVADGSHGRCEGCGAPIPVERLLARPEARRCVPCARRR